MIRAVLAAFLLGPVLAACAGSDAPRRTEPEATAPPEAVELPSMPRESGRPERVVLVAIGALAPDAYLGATPSMPTLAALASAGAAAEGVEPVAPASRAPAAATLVTGRRPASHGVVADRLIAERGVRRAGFDHASLLRGPSLWSEAGEASRPVAALGWPTTVGAAIPLLLPDASSARMGAGWLDGLEDKTTPWLLQLAAEHGGGERETGFPGEVRDAALVGVACAVLTSPSPPELLLLGLDGGRVGVARHGPHAAEARRSFARLDAELARLVECLAEEDRLDSTALVVAGDAGSLATHTAVAANAVLEQAGLLSREGQTLRGWRALARANGGSAFVYARSEADALRARRAFAAEAARGGTFRVVPAQEMLDGGADPEAWFGIEATPGYVFVDAPARRLQGPSARRGASGYLPGQPAMRAGFVAWGRGVRPRVRIPWMRQIDVAPTLGALLGLRLSEAEGRALVGVLNLPAGSAVVPDAAAQPRSEEESERER